MERRMKKKYIGRELTEAQKKKGITGISWGGQVSMEDGTTHHCRHETNWVDEVNRDVEMLVSRDMKKHGKPIVFSVWL